MIPELANYYQNWQRIHQQTLRLLETVPDGQYDWKTCESAMTLGELANHLWQAEVGLAYAAVHGNFPTQRAESCDNTEALVAASQKAHTDAMALVDTLTAEQLSETVTPFGPTRSLPRIVVLNALHEHEIHHRGQLYTYLRMLDVTVPPLFG